MIAQEIREHFQWLIDDNTLDEDRELILLNIAYDELNAERFWNYLASNSESTTIVAGTTAYDLEDDFLYTHSITMFDGDKTYKTFKPVPYRKRLEFKNVGGYYYIDFKNAEIVFLSEDDMTTYAGYTMIHDYQYQPEQLTNDDSPVFNRAFHAMIAYQMAKQYFYNDQGEKSRAWNSEFEKEYQGLKTKMVNWDAQLDVGTNPSTNAVDAFQLG